MCFAGLCPLLITASSLLAACTSGWGCPGRRYPGVCAGNGDVLDNPNCFCFSAPPGSPGLPLFALAPGRGSHTFGPLKGGRPLAWATKRPSPNNEPEVRSIDAAEVSLYNCIFSLYCCIIYSAVNTPAAKKVSVSVCVCVCVCAYVCVCVVLQFHPFDVAFSPFFSQGPRP